jgi:hypothetical protein
MDSGAAERVHALAEGEETQGQGQHGFRDLHNEFTHFLRVRKHRVRVSMDFGT